jgi:Flp pilus assembly protein CpaB
MTNTASQEGAQTVVKFKRPLWSRVSASHVLMVVVGLAAFLANFSVLRSQDEVALVAVAASDLTPGIVFVSDRHVEFVEIAASSPLVTAAVTQSDIADFNGRILSVPLAAGDLVSRSQLIQSAAGDERRAMSIPIDVANAVGGQIIVGDRVDVIAVRDGNARYVLTGAEVIDRSDEGRSGSITGTRSFYLVVAVDANQALELASALDTASIQVLRSTGASPPERIEFDFAPVSEQGES